MQGNILQRVGLGCAIGILTLGLASSCSVLEEIDKIGTEESSKRTEAAPPTSASDSPSTAKAKLQAYYNRRPKRSAPEDPTNPIVRCRLGREVQYLRRHDCDLRGGQPLD